MTSVFTSQYTGIAADFRTRIEVHVLYLALGYFISHLPCDLLAGALSSVVPSVVWLVDIPGPDAASPDDQRHTAALIQQTVSKRLAEKFL